MSLVTQKAVKTKNIFYVINERNGEREYTHKGVAQINSRKDKFKWLDKHMDEMYSNSYKDPNNPDGRIVNGWELYIEAYSVKEISDQEFEVLNRFL